MKLKRKRIVYLVGPGFEDLEFWVPVMRLREEGATVVIAGIRMETYTGKHCLEAKPDITVEQAKADDFDGIVIPGGWAPDKLRRSPAVLNLVRAMNAQNKIIATICHGGHVLISAGIVKGHKATGTTAIKDDLANAGAVFVDEPAFQEDNLVWGRVVKDIPDFCRVLVNALSEK